MLGWGIVKGLGVTLRHFVTTYVEDLKYFPQRATKSAMEYRMAPGSRGIYTIQYPEERLGPLRTSSPSRFGPRG